MSQDIKSTDAQTPLRKVAPKTLAARFDAMMAHAAGTREGADPEELHDMRVASRRLRAALDAFEPCYDSGMFRRVERETKALTRTLGAVRDDDVLRDALRTYTEGIPEDERPALTQFSAHLDGARDDHRAALVRHLDALEASRYAARFHSAIGKPEK